MMNARQQTPMNRTRAAPARPSVLDQSAAQYRHDGYLIARQILPCASVERVFAHMHRLAAQQLARLGRPATAGDSAAAVHEDLKLLFASDLKAYIATLTLCAKLLSLYELYLHPRIRSITEAIGISFAVFQTAPCMHVMSNSLRIPGGYHGFGAHQDWPTLQGSLDTVTVWIPFVEVDRNRFTLEIVPHTHNRGLYPCIRRDHIFEVDPDQYDADGFVPVEAAPGDVVFMSSFAIHRSGTRGDDGLRVATSMRYENAAEPHFIERSYPFAHKRSVVGSLITPDFPSVDQVRRVYEDPSVGASGGESAC
jgi:ectoine hydroxylase-related dioxygenase (phytanoyl-CoA dioxygenase family)